MNRIVRWFLQGLIYFVPIALTVFVLVASFRAIDRALGGLLGTTVPGVGVAVLLVGVTLLGFLLSNFLSRRILGLFERFLDRLPLVKLLHTSVKDLMGAFVGEQRRFDQPVAVEITPGSDVHAFGFVTRDSLVDLGFDEELVAVYLPQSYNFAGQLLAVPRRRVRKIEHEAAEMMALVVSGGVSGKRLPE
ncbi:MAG TPA: DUF502 domain-containing protein [Kofleriaceae bacterium]|jgi:uncharacterized membrane protein|nr:DUF502 domain-containing protein [Kofleriaceae bacterium]